MIRPVKPMPGAGTRGTPRRILVATPQPFFEERGTPIALLYVLRAFHELGYHADVVAFPMGETIEIPGVRYFRTANPLGFRSIRVGFSVAKAFLDLFLAREVVRRLRSDRYDAIHAVEEAAYLASAIGPRFGVPVVYDMASSIPEQLSQRAPFRFRPVQAILRRVERDRLRHIDSVLCSIGLAEHVQAQAPGIRVREWHYPGVECALPPARIAELRRELGIAATSRIIFYGGTFQAYQGLPDLARALLVVLRERPDAAAVLVGATSEADLESVRAAVPAELRDRVRLLRRQPRARIEAFLMMADILVSPRSHGANLPLKIFDYLAAGKVIVATDIPAHRSVLDPSRAILVPPNPVGLAAGLLGALDDPVRADALGRAALEFYRRDYGWPRFVELVGSIYDETIVGRVAPAPRAAVDRAEAG